MKKKIIFALVISVLHFFFYVISMRNAYWCRFEDCTFTTIMLNIAFFPLVHLEKYWPVPISEFDPLDMLIFLNSLFWGIALTALSGWLNKKIMAKRK